MNNNNNNNTANSNNNNNSSNLNAPPSVPGVGANFSNNGFNSNQINLASSAAVSQLQALGMASAASMLTDSLFSHSQASNLSGSQQQQQQQAPVSVNELTAQTHTLTSSSSMPMSSSQHGSTASASASASASDKMDTSGPLGSSLNGGCNLNGLNCNSFGSFGSCSNSSGTAVFVGDVISRLYPNVNQQETPLPRYWSTIHKCQTLALTNNNLRVTYKGPGKTHKDAASVRTDYPIPAACGIYYFEVKIVSKGRDGYMGIGLSKSDVLLSRLPGWDKNSYGYHGDDGHSFCCSGTGQNYGPTFTTGDVIGCCLNLIENTCFYTKNGYNLGIAFRDLPSDLYPTVGLQTPSESVEANFGQYPFEFDVHNYVKEWHLKTRQTIERYPLKKENENNLPITLRKLISTYLVHHGYSATAEAFAKSVGGVFEEELASIRNRQKIQKQVLNGQLAEAIELTYQLFPGILERNPNLLFALKVRQFIEMIYSVNPKPPSSSSSTSHQITAATAAATSTGPPLSSSSLLSSASSSNFVTTTEPPAEFVNSKKTPGGLAQSSSSTDGGADMKDSSAMIVDQDSATTSKHLNGNGLNDSGNGYVISKNGDTPSSEEQMDMDSPSSSFSRSAGKRDAAKNSPSFDNQYLQTILDFGRDLFQMNTRTNLEHGDNPGNTKMLRDAFSLLAYHDPWTSPLGYQLDPSQREPISAMLNSAILEANNMPRIPPLEVVYGQTSECMRLMSKYGVAWCAYVNLTDYMQS